MAQELSKFMKSKYLSQNVKRELQGLAAYKVAKRLLESPLGLEMEEARSNAAVKLIERYDVVLPMSDMEVLRKYGEASPVHSFKFDVEVLPEKYRTKTKKDSGIFRLTVPLLPLQFCLMQGAWGWSQSDFEEASNGNGNGQSPTVEMVWKMVKADWKIYGPGAAVGNPSRCYWQQSFGEMILANLGRITLPEVYSQHYNYADRKPSPFAEKDFFTPAVKEACGLYLALVIEASNEWKQKYCAYQMMINKKANFGSLAAVWPEVVPFFKKLFSGAESGDSCAPITEEDAAAMIAHDMQEGHEVERVQ